MRMCKLHSSDLEEFRTVLGPLRTQLFSEFLDAVRNVREVITPSLSYTYTHMYIYIYLQIYV